MAFSFKSLPVRFLFRLAHWVYNYRGLFLYSQIVLTIFCAIYTIKFLEFHTSRNDLVGGDKEYHRIFLDFKKEFPVQDDLVVVVESEDMEKNRQFIERLGARLERDTNFASVFYKADLPTMGRKALLFVPEDGLRELQTTLNDYRPAMQRFAQATNLVSLFNLINTQFRTARRESNAENSSLVRALPSLRRIIDQATDSLERTGRPPAPGVAALFEGGPDAERQMYITYGQGRIYLATAQAANEKLNESAVVRIRELIDETKFEVPGLNVGLTGEPVLEFDEMTQSQKDTTLATIISLLAVALIFIFGYHETGRPLKATICLLVGLVYTMAFTTFVVGHLNILTITFVPILVGLAIDFGVHLISRYEEELRHGRSDKVALEKAMVNTGLGIFTGAFTTAGAFFAMALADFKGVQEMGIICGGGLVVCLIPMMTLLPILLLRGRQNAIDHRQGEVLDQQTVLETSRRAKLEQVWMSRPAVVVLIALFITALCATQLPKVRFDYNLLHMQSKGLPAVIFQNKLIQSSERSVLFAAVIADSGAAATNLLPALTNLPAVGAVETMATYLTEDQTAKLQLLSNITSIAASLDFAPVDLQPVNVPELRQTLWSLHGYTGLAAKEVKEEDPAIYREVMALRESLGKILNRIVMSDPTVAAKKLADYQQALLKDVQKTFRSFREQDFSGPLRAEDIPPSLRNRFIGVTGKQLLQVYPKKDVWNRAEQEEFVQQLRLVDKHVTGTPVQLFEYTTLLKNSFVQAAQYSVVAIAILVFLHFWSISCVILSLLPVFIGALWTVGLMGVFDIPFNPANIMTLPLIIGIGVTNGIHILNRFAEENHPSILATSTGKAVLVSGLTTIAGFGSLIAAEHQGIRSLGYVMSVGVAACLLVGLTFLPALLNQLYARGWRIKKTQRDNARSTLGREEPR